LTVNCVSSVVLPDDLVIPENTPSNAGWLSAPSPTGFPLLPPFILPSDAGGFPFSKKTKRIFLLTGRTKKQKVFSFLPPLFVLSHRVFFVFPSLPTGFPVLFPSPPLKRREAFHTPDLTTSSPGIPPLKRRGLLAPDVSPCLHGRPVVRYKPARSVSPTATPTAGNGVPPLTPDGTAAPSPGKGLRPFPDPTPARAGTRP